MHGSSPFGLWGFLIVISAFIAIFIYGSIRQKKRTAALTTLAPMLGFNFEGTTWNDPTRTSRLQTAIFNRGHGRRFKNIMSGNFGGLATGLFDYWYTTGGGKNSHTFMQTVVAFSVDVWLPVFELRPEGFFDRISDKFTHKDIDFASNPVFSHRYLLRGPEEAKIRELFTPSLLSFLEQMPPEKKWHFEGDGHTFVLYVTSSQVDPEAVRDFLEATSSIAKMFVSCCGLKSSAKQL
jgi:hypothetical protein